MQPDPAVINRWSGAAPSWEKYRDVIRQMFSPVTEALIQDARIAAGHTVLDVATGPGEPALSVAAAVGPGGKVVGIDPIPGMIDAARRAAERSSFRNAQFEVAFADSLPFPSDHFDAVISRFGAMFFPAPVDAARELLRVLKAGGTAALAVWGPAEANPFFHVLSRIIEQYIDAPSPVPETQDPFRYAAPGKLRDVLSEAGALNPTERVFSFPVCAPISVEDFWTVRIEMSERLRESMAKLSSGQQADAKRQGIEALRQYSTDEGLSIPAQVLIVSGMKR
jgi:ubiquinone/menaquinone biosynthesis C-methylase UbiE